MLEGFVQEQIQETIFDLMRWDEGEFDFEAMPEVADEDIGLSVSIENVIMEGSRRLEEWGRIKKKIPSMDVVFKMATAPGEGTFEISLKPIEWNLLLLVDGTRSVADMARETNRTDFDVARIIYGLFSAGLSSSPATTRWSGFEPRSASATRIVAAARAERRAAEESQREASRARSPTWRATPAGVRPRAASGERRRAADAAVDADALSGLRTLRRSASAADELLFFGSRCPVRPSRTLQCSKR